MKKTVLSMLLLLFICNSLFSQTFSQYFDGADTLPQYAIEIKIAPDSNNIWQVGSPQKPIFNSAFTVPNVIITDTTQYYPDSNRSSFIAKFPIDAWFWGILAFQWTQKLDIDTTGGYDGMIVEYYHAADSMWYNAFDNPYVYNFYGFDPQNKDTLITGEPAFTGTDTLWRDIWFCLDASWLQQIPDTIQFRFTFQSDTITSNHEGVMIDNMSAHLTVIHTINSVKQDKYLHVYPNPAQDIIYIEARKIQGYHIIEEMTLVNVMGQTMQTWKKIPTKFFINTHAFSSGLYYLHIKTNVDSETVPIVINR